MDQACWIVFYIDSEDKRARIEAIKKGATLVFPDSSVSEDPTFNGAYVTVNVALSCAVVMPWAPIIFNESVHEWG